MTAINKTSAIADFSTGNNDQEFVVSLTNLNSLELDKLTNITSLCLKKCKLWQFPKRILHLVNLENLNLSYNQLRKLPIKSLPNLRRLDVSHNLLVRLPAKKISSLLEFMDLSYNQIKKIPDSFLNIQLQTLSLESNKLIKFPNIEFHGMQSLNLLKNSIVLLDLNNIPNLKILFLSMTTLRRFHQEIENSKIEQLFIEDSPQLSKAEEAIIYKLDEKMTVTFE